MESVGYVAFAGVVLGGVKGFLGAKGVNNVLKNTENTITKAGNCFVAGTEILTTEGIKNIEDIRVGDWVIADDPTIPGWIEAKEVLDTFDNEVTELYDLYVDGEVISTTAEHPFWVPDKGWVKASDLVVGDLLQTDEETFVDVDKIERREGNFKVYNFEVEGFPTYFVSELGILVHNTCGDSVIFDAPRKAQTALTTLPNWTPKDKHLASTAAKRSAKFATDDPEEVRNIVQEALTSPNAVFESNNDGDSFRTIADLGRAVGTKGQNKVRVVIGPDSQGNWIIWNAFPQN